MTECTPVRRMANFQPQWALETDKVKSYLLCEQSYAEDRPPKNEDFDEHRSKSQSNLNSLRSLLNSLQDPTPSESGDFLVWTLIFCGEHSSVNPWTTPENVAIATDCLEALTALRKCKSIADLLVSKIGSQPLFRSVLLALRSKLLKESWRLYPAAVHCYKWSLLQIKRPYLSDYLSIVLPTALILMDDHITSRRVIGITCVSHIIRNVTRTELCSQGWDSVLYHTVKPLLLQREPELVTHVYTCMTTLLESTEQGYTKSLATSEWSRLEYTILVLLENMGMEDRLILRQEYVKCLDPLLRVMGPSAIQFSKILLDVFDDYLDKETPDTRHFALLALETYTRSSQERLPSNGEKIVFLLLRTLYDLTTAVHSCSACSFKTVHSFFLCHENRNSPSGLCSAHLTWTSDIDIVMTCLNFVKGLAPDRCGLRHDDVQILNFNDLFTTLLSQVF